MNKCPECQHELSDVSEQEDRIDYFCDTCKRAIIKEFKNEILEGKLQLFYMIISYIVGKGKKMSISLEDLDEVKKVCNEIIISREKLNGKKSLVIEII